MTILLASLVAACSQPAPATIETGEAQPAAASAPAIGPDASSRPASSSKVATLSGEWRVAAIDGIAYDESTGLAVSADAKEIWWEPRCAGHIHPYRIEGFGLRAGLSDEPQTAATGAARGGMPAPVVCAIGLPPRLAEVSRAIRTAIRIERTEQNGVLLSGGGHSLLLFSQ